MQIRFKKKKKREMFAALRSFNKNPIPTPPPPAHLSQPQTGAVRVPHARKALHQQAASVGYSPIAFKGGRAASGAQPARAGGMGAARCPPGAGGVPFVLSHALGTSFPLTSPFAPALILFPIKREPFSPCFMADPKCSVDDKVPLVSSALPTVPFPSPSPARQSPHYQRSLTRWMLSFPASPRIHEAAALHRAQLSPKPSHEAPMRGTRDPSSGHHADLLEQTESITQLCSAHHWPRRPAVLSPILPYLAAKRPPSGEKQSSQRDHGL